MPLLHEVFKEALKNAPTSDLEMTWNLKVDEERYQGLISGEIKPTETEELIMHRFIFKMKQKIPVIMKAHHNGKEYEIRFDQIDPLV